MIAFSPGELSTVATAFAKYTALGMQLRGGLQPLPEKPYNFDDLPCPPYATMVSNNPSFSTYKRI